MSGRVAAVTHRGAFDLIRERLGPRAGLINLVAASLDHVAHAHRRDRRRRARVRVDHERQLPAARAVRRHRGVVDRVAGEVLDAGERVRPGRPGSRRVRRGGLAARTGLGVAGRAGHLPVEATRGGVADLLLLRDRAVRCRDDAVRGVLLLLAARSRSTGRRRTSRRCAPTCSSASRSAASSRSRSRPAPRLVLMPRGIAVDTLGQLGLPVAVALGKVAVAFMLLGFVAATFGAALETALSFGYSISQYFGWQWGKFVRPARCRPLPPRRPAGDHRPAVAVDLDHGRPDQGHRVLDRVLGGCAAAHVLPDPGRRERPARTWASTCNKRLANTLGCRVPCRGHAGGGGGNPADAVDEGGAMSAGRELDLHLDLLDRQIVDRDGRLCGKVDDLELRGTGEGGSSTCRPCWSGRSRLPLVLGGGSAGGWRTSPATPPVTSSGRRSHRRRHVVEMAQHDQARCHGISTGPGSGRHLGRGQDHRPAARSQPCE